MVQEVHAQEGFPGKANRTTSNKNRSRTHNHEEAKSLYRAVANEGGCAKIVRSIKATPRYFVYAGNGSYVDGTGEIAGPLLSLATLQNFTSAHPLDALTKNIGSILQSARGNDVHRGRIPDIRSAYEESLPGPRKYNHLGIFDHAGPFQHSKWRVLIHWENGERTWQPLSLFAIDDFESCATYAREHGLLETKGWKRFRNNPP